MIEETKLEEKTTKTQCFEKTPYVTYRSDFDTATSTLKPDEASIPYQVFPKIFEDNRGGFSESLTCKTKDWMGSGCFHFSKVISQTRQVNRSFSKPGVMRGFHAQKSPWTQGKLVECLSQTPIWDIIVDARPTSKTYKQHAIFKLDCKTMTKVWVPRGFLHGFIVPKYGVEKTEDGQLSFFEYTEDAQFQYFVDNDYSPKSEIVVNPNTVLPLVMETRTSEFKYDAIEDYDICGLLKTVSEGLIFSEKDQVDYSFEDFLNEHKKETASGEESWWV